MKLTTSQKPRSPTSASPITLIRLGRRAEIRVRAGVEASAAIGSPEYRTLATPFSSLKRRLLSRRRLYGWA
jgi:hypothetical protein